MTETIENTKEIITYNDNQYELKFNEKTIETVEALTKKSFMGTVASENGVMSLSDLRQYFASGLYSVDGGRVPAAQGSAVFEAVLKDKGYMFINMLVLTSIQRDCPFFFLAD